MSRRGVKYKSVDDLPPRYREQAIKSLGQDKISLPVKSNPPSKPSNEQRTRLSERSSEDKLNKTEKEYLRILKAKGFKSIRIQDITIRLGDNVRYTPDFFTDDDMTFHEVKGGYVHEDARVKLLTAVRMYPCFNWVFAQKKQGTWKFVNLKP